MTDGKQSDGMITIFPQGSQEQNLLQLGQILCFFLAPFAYFAVKKRRINRKGRKERKRVFSIHFQHMVSARKCADFSRDDVRREIRP